MNSNTRYHLAEFITAVEDLAGAVQIQIGQSLASEIITKAENLKESLSKDETIVESR